MFCLAQGLAFVSVLAQITSWLGGRQGSDPQTYDAGKTCRGPGLLQLLFVVGHRLDSS